MKNMKNILKLMTGMLAIATFALITVSCEETEKTGSPDAGINSITVAPGSLYLEVDATGILTATLSPDDAITDSLTWSTYNKDIATVSVSGPRTAVIKGVSIGTTIINVVTSNSKKAICEVTVSKTVPLLAITITPNDTLLHFEPGDIETLVATQGPANATNYRPVWSSSNTDVVTVENGTVRAVGLGRAVITVTSGNVSKSVNVLVTDPLSSIAIEPAGGLNLSEIGETLQLTAIPTPDNTKNYNPEWTSSNPAVVTVSQTGLVTATGAGTATVTVTNNVSGRISSSVSIKVTAAYLISNTQPALMATGDELQIDPETDESSLTWTSSNESVATVSQTGLVTGISPGVVTVTVSSDNITKSMTVFVDILKSSPSAEEWTAESRNGNHDWRGDGGEIEGAGQPFCAFDGDRTTGWHSYTVSSLPQCLVVDMKTSKKVNHIVIWHLPNAVTAEHHWIYYKTIKVYLSEDYVSPNAYRDGDTEDSSRTPVATYNYDYDIDGDPITVNFAPDSQGRYLILFFPDSSAEPHISFAELDVYYITK
jgi:uncharacterized protein YjdB